MTVNNKDVPLEDAGIILSGLCDFVQGVYDLKMYHVKMQRQFLQEKGMTQEELKDIEANAPDQYALIKAEAKTWLKGQEGLYSLAALRERGERRREYELQKSHERGSYRGTETGQKGICPRHWELWRR